ncbi:MAG: hypothetical protein M1814_001750 [Vezdaea aestivalis]|nr:MAG: hypothetical protein M1814_001750 [Vezdaea aestivalis]
MEEIHSTIPNHSRKLICITPKSKDHCPEKSDILELFLEYSSILFIKKNRDGVSWDLVVDSDPASLDEILPDFEINIDYDPVLPIEGEESVYGKIKAQQKALDDYLDAVKDVKQTAGDNGAYWCYSRFAVTNGLDLSLIEK